MDLNHIFFYGESHLTVGVALKIARNQIKGVLSDSAKEKVQKSSQIVEQIVEKNETVYGINTGFGSLCTTKISKSQAKILQSNILQSHSVGVGEPISNELAKLMLILKVHALAKGFSGIALTTLVRIVWHIDNDVIPVVPSQGSVGASGDLAPLSHLFLPLIGLGELMCDGQKIRTQDYYRQQQLKPIELSFKEGLALINGTQFILAHAVQAIHGFYNCLTHADIFGAMMIDALQGSIKPFYEELHQLRPFKGNLHVAHRIKTLLQDSQMLDSHKDCNKVQDPYSLRCIPQVHGSSRTAWLHLKELVEIELNAITDNPLIINDKLTISGGNFHGQPLAMALDYACLAASELGNISDRRIYLALEGGSGVPQLLMKDTGVNSGYMILQYTTAALASENKTQCFPASADSIPTSLGQEDHVSMGSISGRKILKVLANVEKILAVELLTAAQAFDFRRPLKSGIVIDEIHQYFREHVPFADKDRVFAYDIDLATELIRKGAILQFVNQITERENIDLTSSHSQEFEIF